MSASTAPVSARSWRDIPQNIAPRAMSATGRRRMAMATIKSVVILAATCISAFVGYEIWQMWQDDPAKLRAPVKNSPLQKIETRTNGVLDLTWVEQTLALPKAVDLMELDLYALREKLMASGQVKAAVLSRKFPHTLVATLDERTPVAQIRTESGGGEYTDYLVARDGVVFEGAGFDPEMISALPYLDLASTKLTRTRTGFAPLVGMETIADLLNTARGNVPNLYRTWKVISLARYFSDGEIVVRSKDVAEIIFGTREMFYKQIAQLDFILDEVRNRPEKPKTINLAIGGREVPVAFEPPAQPLPPPPVTSRPRSQPAIQERSAPIERQVTPERTVTARSYTPAATGLRPNATIQPLRAAPRRPTTVSTRQRPTLKRDF